MRKIFINAIYKFNSLQKNKYQKHFKRLITDKELLYRNLHTEE